MDIWIYSDESGVFDKKHERFFVFGGVILLSENDKDIWTRKYIHAENSIRGHYSSSSRFEVKASNISNTDKSKLFRSLNQCFKFGTIIDMNTVNPPIFTDKKHKQRYLDYAYKIALKQAFKELITKKIIKPSDIRMIYVFPDEHTTATSGRYELHENLEREFKIGTFNMDYSTFFPPLFPNLMGVQVQYCNSSNKPLVRASDIIANHIYYCANESQIDSLASVSNLFCINQPK